MQMERSISDPGNTMHGVVRKGVRRQLGKGKLTKKNGEVVEVIETIYTI